MPDMNLELADGTEIRIRPVLPADKDKLELAMGRLSPAARRHRFFSSRERLGAEFLAYLTEVDYTNHFAWLALAVDEPGEPVVGVGRYVRFAEEPVAEVAFAVDDAFQGRGLATILFEVLATVARSNGILRFKAFVLADNVPMRQMLAAVGARFQFDEPGVVRTVIDLPEPSTKFDQDAVAAAANVA